MSRLRFNPVTPLVLPALLASLGVACRPSAETSSVEVPKTAEPELAVPDPSAALSSEPAPPLARLAPVFRPSETPKVIPETLTLTFAEPLAPEQKIDEGTAIEIEPTGLGVWSWTSPRTLTLTPAAPLPPETSILTRVRSLATRSGFSAGEPLSFRFETPAFDLLEATPREVKPERAVLDVVFSGPVDVDAARKVLVAEIGGRPVKQARYSATDTSNVIRLEAEDRLIGQVQEMRIAVTARLPMKGGRTFIKERSTRVKLHADRPEARVLNVALVEGSEGWLLHVICTDQASSDPNQYFYSAELGSSYQVSNRCVLDEADVDAVELSPSRALRVVGDSGGFRVLGDLPRGPLEFRLKAGARTVDGGVFRQTYAKTLEVKPRTPQLAFTTAGRYVPTDRIDALPFRALNVSDFELQVDRVRPEGLVFWAGQYSEETSAQTADPVASVKMKLDSPTDVPVLDELDLTTVLEDAPHGLYQVRIREIPPQGARRAPQSAVLRVVVTDLDILAKKGDGFVDAWVIDTHDLSAKSGVEVRLVQPSGATRARCETDGEGWCRIELDAKEVRGVRQHEPFGLVVQNGEDVSYLAFEEVRTPSGEANISGEHTGDGASPFAAAAWMDRGIYRPGETAHLSVTVWDKEKLKAPPAGLPVELRLSNPRGQEVSRVVLETNGSGLVTRSHPFSAATPTGRYRYELRVGDRWVGSETFLVEAFVPERMRVDAAATKADLVDAEPLKVKVDAQWLFGGSAEGSRVSMLCRAEPITLKMRGFESYHFGPSPLDRPEPRQLGTVSGTLDASGAAELACPALDARARGMGPARISAEVSVFEGEGGRATRASARGRRLPTDVLIGLRTEVEVAEAGKPIAVEGVLLGADGTALKAEGQLTVELLRVERENAWVYDEDSGYWSYTVHERLSGNERIQTTAEAGRFSFQVTPGSAAPAYLIRVEGFEARSELRVQGDPWGYRRWWAGAAGDRTPSPGAPESVPLTLPKSLKKGEAAKVVAEVPFAGRILYTVETDRIHHQEWKTVEAGPVEFDLRVEELVPNVYVSVLAIEDPHAASKESFVPARGWGLGSVRILPEPLLLDTKVEVPETLRSNTPLEVKVSAAGAEGTAQVIAAVVDEGILSLTRFATPKPIEELFAKRALEVQTFDTVGWNLVLPASGPSGRTGGGADANEPPAAMPVEPVALWSGPVELEDGEATLRFDMPEYRGKLRVMVAVVSPTKVGHAEARVVVRDPIVVEPTYPRTLTAQDTAEVPVLVTNLSGEHRDIELSLSVRPLGLDEGGVDAAAEPESLLSLAPARQSLSLADGDKETVWLKLEAKAPAGAVEIRAVARAGDIETGASANVVLRPHRPTERSTQLLRLEGDGLDIASVLGDWIPGTDRTQIVLTRNPYAKNAGHLKYLVGYPHGCVEQTSSKMRALLYVDRFLPGLKLLKERPRYLRSGIDRLVSMQTTSGGFAYWPGGQRPTSWATAYVLDLFLDLEKEGVPVPSASLERGLEWAEELVERRSNDYAVPYLHYVLAKAKRGRLGQIEAALEQLDRSTPYGGRTRERRTLLWAAKYLAGDRRAASELKTLSENPPERWERYNGWTFYSDRRRWALELGLLVELFGAQDWLEAPLRTLGEGLEHTSSYYTTQELVWTLTALGRALPPDTEALPSAQLKDARGTLAPTPGGDDFSRSWSVPRATAREDLHIALESPTERPPYVLLVTEGVRPTGEWEVGGEGLSVHRRLTTLDGEPVTGPVPLGTRVLSVTEIENEGRDHVHNLALVDVFPAGFEPISPRLDDTPKPAWMDAKDVWSTDYVDVLDDRAKAFGGLSPRAKRVFYVPLRAVTAGTQSHPPVHLEAMYDPSRWARALGTDVTIERP